MGGAKRTREYTWTEIGRLDSVFAAVFNPRAESPRARLYGRKISQAFVWAVTGSLAIRDPLCGFRCFPLARTLPLLDRVTLGDRMDFDPEIVVRLAWEGVPIVNVPTRVRYFPGGLSHFRMVRDNVRIARTYLRLVGARVRRGVR